MQRGPYFKLGKMEIFTAFEQLNGMPVAATIGSFDGVHRGHVAMIAEARSLAKKRGLPLVVVTFARHPRLLFSGCNMPFLLSSNDEKIALIEKAGADAVMLLPFDNEMASFCARDFMHTVLSSRMNVRMLAVGYDHHFGRPCSGEGIEEYKKYGCEAGIEVIQMTPYEAGGVLVSSSKVRGALAAGDMSQVSEMLGRYYSIDGTVVHGAALGRRLGFPTANISLSEPLKLLPLDGVYECNIHVATNCYKGVMNIGCKPTINSGERTIEVFIIDFEGDIYNEHVKVDVVRRLRGERRFAGLDDLRSQIMLDVQEVKNINNK